MTCYRYYQSRGKRHEWVKLQRPSYFEGLTVDYTKWHWVFPDREVTGCGIPVELESPNRIVAVAVLSSFSEHAVHSRYKPTGLPKHYRCLKCLSECRKEEKRREKISSVVGHGRGN